MLLIHVYNVVYRNAYGVCMHSAGIHKPSAVIKEKIMRASYRFSARVSPDAKDLIQRVFRVDPLERTSVPEMLGHSWMRAASSSPASKLVSGASDSPLPCSAQLGITPLCIPPYVTESAQVCMYSAYAYACVCVCTPQMCVVAC